MPAFDNAPWLGDHRIAHSSAELEAIHNYDKAHGSPHVDRTARAPAGISCLVLALYTAVNANTVDSVRFKAPYPLEILRFDPACESAAGSAATANLKTDDGTTDQSILLAAVDIKTTAGFAVPTAPDADKNVVEYGTEIYMTVIGTGAGAVVGSQAKVWYRRL